jgi:hypothetical protein
MAFCHVLLAGFQRLEAELLIAGLRRQIGIDVRAVEEQDLAESAARYGATAVLLGQELESAEAVIADCQERSPDLVIVQLSALGTTARLTHEGKSDLVIEQISIDLLALLLCGGQRGGAEPRPKGHLPSRSD